MNQRVLITGASHGIGKAAAERFAKEGCTLILNCRQSVEELSALEFYLKKNYSVDCISLIGDVSSPDFVKEMFEKTMERFGGIDILINNAGISHIGLLGDMSNEEWHRVMGINLDSVFYCCREAIPYMLSKLEKYFTPDTDVFVTLSVEKERQKIEVTIPVKGNIIRSEQVSNDMYVSIDLVEEVIERQLKKYKNKLVSKQQNAANFRKEFIEKEVSTDDEIQIIRTKRFGMKPMYPEDACVQMELLGHNFFVFRNAETEEVNVVYKRKGNTYGLIEPEF